MKNVIYLFVMHICTLFPASAQLCFSPASNYAAGTLPNSITSADFNGDGRMDLATTNFGSNNVSVLLKNASGWDAAINFIVGTSPHSITNGDFNGDGKIDLATANSGTNNVSVLIGDGIGGFSEATYFEVGTQPLSITCADFNGDGKLDLVSGNTQSNSVSILLGNGTGGFSTATSSYSSYPYSICSSDFNGDGKLDIAATNNPGNSVHVKLGDGAGAFTYGINFTVGSNTNPVSVISDDFNGDGHMDIATANSQSNNVSVLLGSGTGISGGFSAATQFTVGTSPYSIIKADFNGDGSLDLATANYGSNNLSVLYGNGTGGFSAAVNFDVGTTPQAVISADFNADGNPDLATANNGSNNVSVLLGSVSFTVSSTNVTCNGGSNGTATVNITCGASPYSYSWNTTPVQTTATATGLTAGTYTVTVTDVGNSSAKESVTITEPIALSAVTSSTPNSKCSGTCNGTASVDGMSGGPSPYTYLWDASANNQVTATATNLCQGEYNVTITDKNGCKLNRKQTVTVVSEVNVQVYLTNLAAVDQVNVSPSFSAYYTYNLPSTITANPSNPRNFVDPGKKARFKVECTNKKSNGQSIVSGICKVRSNNPYISITDSSSALNNIGWNNFAWSADEFEVDIDPGTPAGTNAYIDFVVQEAGQNYSTTCIAIPISPLNYSATTPSTIDDDDNPDSKGNDNDICEPNEIIEFYPWLDNISTLDAEYVRGRFENLDNHSFIDIWNNIQGVGTTVYDATWWNYAFAQPQTINSNSINTTPEYDFVFNYGSTGTESNFKLYMVMAGGFNLFSGNALTLVQWTLPYTFNSTGVTSNFSAIDNLNRVNVSPNPSDDYITIENVNFKINSTYVLHNPMGQAVLMGNLTGKTTSVDISQLPLGIYYIHILGNENQSIKLIKK